MDDARETFEQQGYELGDLVARDCFGELYEAFYPAHGRGVLLRRLANTVAENEDAWGLLLAEVQAWARLNHPGILQVLDWGRAGGESFFVTEAPLGPQLEQVLGGGLTDFDAVFSNLLTSVEAARNWGVLHLGLGPANIWVADDCTVQVGDFGLWYVSLEFPGLLELDDRFLAPEQLERSLVSAATDTYALGLLYIAMRFGLDTAAAVRLGGELPGELRERLAVVARCLDPKPLARFRCAGDVAEALGWPTTDGHGEEYRDCPLCRLKEELSAEAGRRGPRGFPVIAYPWVAIIALAIASLIVWWLALH